MNQNRKPKGLRLRAGVLLWILRLLVGWVPYVLYRYHVTGRRNVPRKGPVIVVPNHLSDLDPGLIVLLLGRQVVAIAMAELWKWPVFKHIVSALGMIKYERRSALSGVTARRLSLEVLRHGGALLVFSQGGCVPPGEEGTWYPGFADFAVETGAVVVPTGVSGTEKFGRYARRFRQGEVRKDIWVRFGEPIDPTGHTSEELLELVKKEAMRLAQEP